jgi:hypothetical protein
MEHVFAQRLPIILSLNVFMLQLYCNQYATQREKRFNLHLSLSHCIDLG